MLRQAASVPFETSALLGVMAWRGVKAWGWGQAPFYTTKEGWFGSETHYLGADKLGHAFSTYVMADLLTNAIRRRAAEAAGAPVTAALISFGIMAGVEYFDGTAKEHGFSREDIAANGAGALLAMARNTIPGLKETLDFRFAPLAGGTRNGDLVADYSRQRYLFALKLGGLDGLKETPLRLLELHVGFRVSGVMPDERARGAEAERSLYFGVGLNVSELLFAGPSPLATHGDSWLGQVAKSALSYVQFPGTSLGDETRWR